MSASHVIRDFVCTACGCMCDDLAVTVEGGRIVSFQPPCPVAERFLLADHDPPAADAASGAAIAQAAHLLHAARAPLVMGFERATVDAQRRAVELADRLGAVIDPTDDHGTSRSHAAVQTVGAVTATLGEAAQRSDLVVYWECDPATTHPRHLDRFAGRSDQHVVVVANWPTPSAALADEYFLIPPGSGWECLWTLRALVGGVALDADAVEVLTGNPLVAWRQLVDRLQKARYTALFYDAASRVASAAGNPVAADGRGGCEGPTQAITELVRDLHRHTRAAALPLGRAFNAVGAAQVMTWQTGFPGTVTFAHGRPQYLPGEAVAARLLARGEVDAALVIAADPLPHLPTAAAKLLRSLPLVVIDDRPTATLAAATVALPTAPFGLATAGDVYRSDGVALPLRPAMTSRLPEAATVLGELLATVERGSP